MVRAQGYHCLWRPTADSATILSTTNQAQHLRFLIRDLNNSRLQFPQEMNTNNHTQPTFATMSRTRYCVNTTVCSLLVDLVGLLFSMCHDSDHATSYMHIHLQRRSDTTTIIACTQSRNSVKQVAILTIQALHSSNLSRWFASRPLVLQTDFRPD